MQPLLLLPLLMLPAALAAASPLGVSSPLIVWSSQGILSPGQGSRASYQTLTNVENVAGDLVLGALGQLAATAGSHHFLASDAPIAQPSTVVVYVGSQLDSSDLRRFTAPVSNLESILENAASSLVLPYTATKGASVQDSIVHALANTGVSMEVIGCGLDSTDVPAAVASALKAQPEKQQVLVVCSKISALDDRTEAGLQSEVEQLTAVQKAVEQSSAHHFFVYATQPSPSLSNPAARRRSLLQAYTGFGPYQNCGILCQTQVRWLEGMLAILFLALASCSGLLCLYVLDTPTRFETAKEN